jgi:hypothetical protein
MNDYETYERITARKREIKGGYAVLEHVLEFLLSMRHRPSLFYGSEKNR